MKWASYTHTGISSVFHNLNYTVSLIIKSVLLNDSVILDNVSLHILKTAMLIFVILLLIGSFACILFVFAYVCVRIIKSTIMILSKMPNITHSTFNTSFWLVFVTLRSYGSPLSISGAIQKAEPTRESFRSGSLAGRSPTSLARPKSVTTASRPRDDMRIRQFWQHKQHVQHEALIFISHLTLWYEGKQIK